MNGSDSYGASIEHEAPPAPRGFSGLAITAFVLSIVLGIPAIIGLWWAEALALLFGVFALGATGAFKKRGRGLAIAGTVIAVVGGALSFVTQRAIATAMEQGFLPVAHALATNDQETLKHWMVEGDEQAATLDHSTKRMAAAQESLGKFAEKLEIGNVFWGFLAAYAVPAHGEEFEPKGDRDIRAPEAMWVRATFEKGDAWIALRILKEGALESGDMKSFKSGSGKEPMHLFHDVRIFRAAPGK